MKPLFSLPHLRLNLRFIIAGLLFLFIVIILVLMGMVSMFGDAFSHILPVYNWLLWAVILSFVVAFIDILFVLTMFVLTEFVIILAVAYILSLTGLFSFNSVFIYFENGEHGAILSGGLYLFTIITYYKIWRLIPEKVEKKYRSKRYEFDNGSEQEEAQALDRHTKEELVRLLNLWQTKYSQAKTDEARKMANEMILKYTDELKEGKEQNGTTPERARLKEGGDMK